MIDKSIKTQFESTLCTAQFYKTLIAASLDEVIIGPSNNFFAVNNALCYPKPSIINKNEDYLNIREFPWNIINTDIKGYIREMEEMTVNENDPGCLPELLDFERLAG